MALSIEFLYKFTLDLVNKNIAGGLPNEKFERLWNDAQASYLDDLLGRFQARNNGKEGANTGLIENETILQKLSPFIKVVDLTVAGNEADKPTDFVYRLAMRLGSIDSATYDIKKINYNQIASVMNSVIDAPSAADHRYYFLEYEGYYEFLPHAVAQPEVALDYVSQPPEVKWAYTYDAEGRQIYNPGLSVQPLWDTQSCREVSKRVLKTLGISFKDQDFKNFGNEVIAQGE